MWSNQECMQIVLMALKVGRWVDDWCAGLPDEYEVGGFGPGSTVVEAE